MLLAYLGIFNTKKLGRIGYYTVRKKVPVINATCTSQPFSCYTPASKDLGYIVCARSIYFNHFPNKPCFLRVWNSSLLKTLWENEKMLVTSIFSFSHNVFYPNIDRNHLFRKS